MLNNVNIASNLHKKDELLNEQLSFMVIFVLANDILLLLPRGIKRLKNYGTYKLV